MARCSRFELNEVQHVEARETKFSSEIFFAQSLLSEVVYILENCDKRGKFTERESEVIALQKVMRFLQLKLSAAVIISS